MNSFRLLTLFAVLSALMFVACGDDGSTKANGLPDEVADKKELNTYDCDMSVIGKKVFVTDLDKNYECDGDKWFESYEQPKSRAKGKSSSSSKGNSSSNNGKSSSSNKVNSSSSVKQFSSSSSSRDNTSIYDFVKEEYFNPDIRYGELKDERDGKIYRTIKIGDQEWMAENLNYYDTLITPNFKKYITYCQGKSPLGCDRFGRSYCEAAAVDVVKLNADKKDSLACDNENLTKCLIDVSGQIQGLCPAGWHLPDTTEWIALFDAVGAVRSDDGWTGAEILKSRKAWFSEEFNGSDDYGFSAVPFNEEGKNAFFWTSTPFFGESDISQYQYAIELSNESHENDIKLYASKFLEVFAIRCVKDDRKEKKGWWLPKCDSSNEGEMMPENALNYICKKNVWHQATDFERDVYGNVCTDNEKGRLIRGNKRDTIQYVCTKDGWVYLSEWNWDVPKDLRLNPEINYDSIVDKRDGQVYKVVTIGNRVWMAQNLNYADSAQTPSLLENNWCYDDVDENCEVGGRLYTWFVAKEKGICPEGWHVPSREEWDAIPYNPPSLRSKNGWNTYYERRDHKFIVRYGNGYDEVGFSAIPAGVGLWYKKRGFEDAGEYAVFWSSSERDSTYAYGFGIINNYDDKNYLINHKIVSYAKIDGLSIRCVKDDE